jgi:signal transduction histidine kinase
LDRSQEIFVSDIFILLLFSIGGYVIYNFKRKYEILSEQLINANKHIIKSHRDLEVTIDDRTLELKRLNKELDRLFYRSSHDFRRPLTTLMGINEVARLIKLESSSMELMQLMDKTVNDMDRMLKKFYNLYEINHFPEDNKAVSLYAIVEKYARDLIDKGHGIKWSIELESYEEINIKNALIKIILKNLLENAVQYSKNGKADIKVNFFEDNSYLVFKVSDNGIGIDDSFHTQIFEMYFRATEVSQGNGLGLYVVKTAVEKLHGNIRVISERGKQTIFIIRFPI